jgi:light-regulated signal transduction histidine kinase (bacteriophytochrome)
MGRSLLVQAPDQDKERGLNVQPDISVCDREAIHLSGAIQPYGVMLVADGDGRVRRVAGDVEGLLGLSSWQDVSVAKLIGHDLGGLTRSGAGAGMFVGRLRAAGGEFDVSAHLSGEWTIVELEPASTEPKTPAALLGELDRSATLFERAPNLQTLCDVAAAEFRKLTGYDRVMVYHFLDDGAGAVLAEDRRPDMHSFLHHHFPASDIPRQARALYLRNLVRVIPDADYNPAPLSPDPDGNDFLDLSDSILRSVSPVHLHYLKNMGVRASASVSIVKEGQLWGLVACHNETPRLIPFDARAGARALAGAFARQIKAKEEAEGYRERIRLRSFEDETVALLSREGSLEAAIAHHLPDVGRILGSDGVAVLRGGDIATSGTCPPPEAIRALAAWLGARTDEPVFATDQLGADYPPAANFADIASGVLAITLSAQEPWIALWFRAEAVSVIEWAGNPHKGVQMRPGEKLTPRASFEAWRETIRGRARPWTVPETEAAGRLRLALLEVRRGRQLQDLNRQLIASLNEKDLLLQEKQFLIGEVNHRVQNSLQLVSSFLALQARASDLPELRVALDEAQRRLGAVALVHRRLYRGDQVELVEAARYIEELCADTVTAIGEDWRQQILLDVAPLLLPADRAVTVGLVLTELIINATKYAYAGQAGPLEVSLQDERVRFRLVVADRGRGKSGPRHGFGTRMIEALVAQLGGSMAYEENKPGLRAVLTAPNERTRSNQRPT